MKPWQLAAMNQEPTKGDFATSNHPPEIDAAWAALGSKAQKRWLKDNPYGEDKE